MLAISAKSGCLGVCGATINSTTFWAPVFRHQSIHFAAIADDIRAGMIY
jgi:hypothetical protein